MERINNKNYFDYEHRMKYTGSSEIKAFLECEAGALAKLKGEFEDTPSKAQIVSSYIDSVISAELEDFKEEHPEIFLKNGELKADYKQADEVIKQMCSDDKFMKYLEGKHQKIMIGKISGVPVKIKMDSYHKGKCIVDLKCIASFDLIWNEKTKQKENFIDYYDYITQAAIYQEIVWQNTGELLPFVIAAATKEKYSQRALLMIPSEKISMKLSFLQQYLPHLQAVKQGKIEPRSCGVCPYCISKKKCDKIYYYDNFFEERNK